MIHVCLIVDKIFNKFVSFVTISSLFLLFLLEKDFCIYLAQELLTILLTIHEKKITYKKTNMQDTFKKLQSFHNNFLIDFSNNI